jgi:hypothetical protein
MIITDPVIARYRRAGVQYSRAFNALTDAYDFLHAGVADENVDMDDIESEAGTVIVSAQAFAELERLDQVHRDGWLAVLSQRLAAEKASSTAVPHG